MLRRSVLLLTAALVLQTAGCGGKLVGRDEEMRFGEQAAKHIEREYPLSKDEQLQWLVERIGRPIAANSSRPDVDFTFRVLDNKEINALSVPGYVYINTGLVKAVNANRDELAAVIAHEVAHTTQRHMAKQLERIYGATFLLNVVASGSSAVDTAAQIGLELALRGYSRQDEREADAQALRFMSRAGYNPWAMVRFFEQLRKETGDPGGLNKYFATHPMTSERIQRASDLIRKEGLAPASSQ